MPQVEPKPRRSIPALPLALLGLAIVVAAFLFVRGWSGEAGDVSADSAQPTRAPALTPAPAPSLAASSQPGGAPAAGDASKAQASSASGQREAQLVPVVTAGEIAANPALYYGRTVSVHAEIEEVLDGRSFTLDEERIGASPDVLVLMPNATPAVAPPDDTFVTVVGQVQPFVESRLSRAFSWFNPNDEVMIRLRSRPVIIAEWVRTQHGAMLTTGDTSRHVLVTNPGRIASLPGRFDGERVLLADATIDEVRSSRSFTLDDPAYLVDQDLLVLLPPQKQVGTIEEDQVVTVRGTVRRYRQADFERDYDWFRGGDFGNLNGRENQPVLVADLMRGEDGSEYQLMDNLDWTSRTRIDGEDWWVRRAWEPLPRGRTDSDVAATARQGQDPGRQQQPQADQPRGTAGQPEERAEQPRGTTGQQPAADPQPQPMTDLQMLLDAADRQTFAGRRVALDRAQVQQVIGDGILLVGPSADRVVAVRMRPNTATVSPGGTVRLEGAVRTVPGSLDGWQLDLDEKRALQSRNVFIDADSVDAQQP